MADRPEDSQARKPLGLNVANLMGKEIEDPVIADYVEAVREIDRLMRIAPNVTAQGLLSMKRCRYVDVIRRLRQARQAERDSAGESR